MRYRMIGPERGGRVTAVTGVPSQPHTFYMGSTGGGVWKTTDAGHTWVNISDGILRGGFDGRGRSLALRPQRRLRGHRLVEDPQQCLDRPRHLQVHRRGQDLDVHRPARRRPDRDRSRPSDESRHRVRGGARQSVRRQQGARRLSQQRRRQDLEERAVRLRRRAARPIWSCSPAIPNVLFACMWHGQRKPWTIISGASEGGIYKSTDGGDTWTKLAGGLPHELFGRANVAISARAAESHLRADRSQARLRPVPLRRRGRDVDADQRLRQSDHAAVLLRHARRRSEQRRRRLRRQRRLVQEHRRRQDLPPLARSARRQSRHLDQSEEFAIT